MKTSQWKSEITLRLVKMKTQHTKALWDTTKTENSKKVIAKNTYIEKEERSQINNLTFQLKTLEKEVPTKLNADRRKV